MLSENCLCFINFIFFMFSVVFRIKNLEQNILFLFSLFSTFFIIKIVIKKGKQIDPNFFFQNICKYIK